MRSCKPLTTQSKLRFVFVRRGNAETELPANLTPGSRTAMDPALSLAWENTDGRVLGFILACMSSPGNYALLSAWRSGRAPFGCFHLLLKAQLQRCFCHGNGDFIYHVYPTSARAESLVERYAAGKFKKTQMYSVRLSLSEEGNTARDTAAQSL